MSVPLPPASVPPEKGVAPDGRPYAPWGARALGFFLDLLPVLILSAIAQAFFVSSTVSVDQNWAGGPTYQVLETRGPGVMFYLLELAGIVYWFWNKGYLEGTTGQSLAKRFLGYRTESGETGEPIGIWFGMLRALLVYIEFALILACGLGLIFWLWPAWDPNRQALLSDRATRAVVFKTDR